MFDSSTRSSPNSLSFRESQFSGMSASSSKSPNNAVQRSIPLNNPSHIQRSASDKSRRNSRDSPSNLTNPSPPPGSLPPDYFQEAPNPAMQPAVAQPHLPFPGSFLTQHPQFPHVFILNTMGGQVGGQMMMQNLSSIGQMQQPLPNQP